MFATVKPPADAHRLADRFWGFCDDPVELVKSQTYGDHGETAAVSAHRALTASLSVLQRLLAPFLPLATEEGWSRWQGPGSIHRSAWPTADELESAGAACSTLAPDVAGKVIREARRAKAEVGVALRTPVAELTVTASQDRLAALGTARGDVLDAAHAMALRTRRGQDMSVTVELASA